MTLSTALSHSSNGNGNGRGPNIVHERGLAHRNMTHEERVKLAADVATDKKKFVPSMAHLVKAFEITDVELRKELKRRWFQEAELLTTSEAIAFNWEAATKEEKAEAVRRIGVADVWDTIAAVTS